MHAVDIVILSYARDSVLSDVTKNAIKTLLDSEDSSAVEFRVLVIESNKNLAPYQYPNSKTIYPEIQFGFNKYLNIGIRSTNANFICLCNNDLVFHKGWASNIIIKMESDRELLSASPRCSYFHGENAVGDLSYGYENGTHVAGWCFFVKRELFKVIGELDEKFVFWYCDDDYRLTLKKHNVKHALVNSSVVDHLESQTLNSIEADLYKDALTKEQKLYFDFKWSHRSKSIYLMKKLKYIIEHKLFPNFRFPRDSV